MTRPAHNFDPGPETRNRLGIPHPRPFVHTRRVGASDLGEVLGHVSNVRYVGWLDEAAEAHATRVGCSRRTLLDQSVMWFVARHEIDYLAETWLDDELRIFTWVDDFTRIKSWRSYVVYRPTDDVIVARARTLWVLVDLTTRRPTRIGSEFVDRFEPLDSLSPTVRSDQ